MTMLQLTSLMYSRFRYRGCGQYGRVQRLRSTGVGDSVGSGDYRVYSTLVLCIHIY